MHPADAGTASFHCRECPGGLTFLREERIQARTRLLLFVFAQSATCVLASIWVHSGIGLKLPASAVCAAVKEPNARRDENASTLQEILPNAPALAAASIAKQGPDD